MPDSTPNYSYRGSAKSRLKRLSQQNRELMMQEMKNPTIGKVVVGRGGRISMDIDFSGAVFGFKMTNNIASHLIREIRGVMFAGLFRELVLKTPVWRGTARLNWKVSIGEATATYKGVGAKGGFLPAVDDGLKPVANKLGNIRVAGGGYKPLSSGAKLIGANREDDKGEEEDVYQEDGSIASFRNQLTQEEFGKETVGVERLLKNVDELLARDFKLNPKARMKKFPKITIANETPYIRFLEGTGIFGAKYRSGSRIYSEKSGSNFRRGLDTETGLSTGTFVRQSPLGSTDEKYESGFIGEFFRAIKGATRNFNLDKQREIAKSRKESRPLGADRKSSAYKAQHKKYMKEIWRPGKATTRVNKRGEVIGAGIVQTASEEQKERAEAARLAGIERSKQLRAARRSERILELRKIHNLGDAFTDKKVWEVHVASEKAKKAANVEEANEIIRQNNERIARVRQQSTDASNKRASSRRGTKKKSETPAKVASDKKAPSQKETPSTKKAKEVVIDASGNKPKKLYRRKNETGSQYLARKRKFEDDWWKLKKNPPPAPRKTRRKKKD
jgi:hypothetical protein